MVIRDDGWQPGVGLAAPRLAGAGRGLFTVSEALVVLLHVVVGLRWLRVPSLPVAVVGGALGIFVSFRTNAAYARWWEGRQLWGRLINNSRLFATQVLTYPAGPFTLFYNGLPLSALCRTIENNLRHRLGDTELEPMLQPNERGVLM